MANEFEHPIPARPGSGQATCARLAESPLPVGTIALPFGPRSDLVNRDPANSRSATLRVRAGEAMAPLAPVAGVAACLARLEPLHARLCPRQVLGVRLGLYAAELLDLRLPRSDKRLLVVAEADGCFADGISVATGCWVGRRTLRIVDYGKVAATFVDVQGDRAVRVWPRSSSRGLARTYAPGAASTWQAQLLGYQAMPAAELLRAEAVELRVPTARLLGRPGRRVTCQACGEEIMNERELQLRGTTVCVACAGEPYYRAVAQVSPASDTGGRLNPPAT